MEQTKMQGCSLTQTDIVRMAEQKGLQFGCTQDHELPVGLFSIGHPYFSNSYPDVLDALDDIQHYTPK